eukprot:m.400493 g.400493  ORF g.400493 m.400493 type:complete len:96 (-) comp21159_c0_seq26:454-741(-)
MSVLHRCITLSHRAGDCAADVRCVTWHRHPWFDQVVKTDVEPAVKQFFLRRGYYGAVSYTDYHFGTIVNMYRRMHLVLPCTMRDVVEERSWCKRP